MNNFYFSVLGKDQPGRTSPLIASTLVIATALLLGNPSSAQVVAFRLALADVAGVEKIIAGDIQAGITVLEDQLKLGESKSKGDMLATLCAAHILNDRIDKAKRPCNDAVAVNPSRMSYNNRGVYRSHRGDLAGAREDFDHAQPQHLETYLDELKAKDVGLIANDNFLLVDELLAKHEVGMFNAALPAFGADIEDLND
jgi:hypothetical protein